MKELNSLAPGLIKQTSDEVDGLAQHRIKQIMDEGNQQVEIIAPKIICGAINDVHKTPFRLLGSSGRNNCHRQKDA